MRRTFNIIRILALLTAVISLLIGVVAEDYGAKLMFSGVLVAAFGWCLCVVFEKGLDANKEYSEEVDPHYFDNIYDSRYD